MALSISGSKFLITGNSAGTANANSRILQDFGVGSFSMLFRYDTAQVNGVSDIFRLGSFDTIFAAHSVTTPNLGLSIATTGNIVSSLNVVPAVGQIYHIAAAWSSGTQQQIWYVNGTPHTTNNWTQGAGTNTASPFGIGNANSASNIGSIFTFQDVAFWSGYQLTSTDVGNLLHRRATPTGISPSRLSHYWSLTGPSGQLVNQGGAGGAGIDLGLLNQGVLGSGSASAYNLNYFSYNGVDAQSGVATWTAENMTFVSPVSIQSAYVSRPSSLIVFILQNTSDGSLAYGSNTVNSNPSILVDGSFIQLTGGVTLNDCPFLIYNVASSIPNTATVTFTAQESWVDNPSYGLGAPQTGYLANRGGQIIFPIPTNITAKFGYEISGPHCNSDYSDSPFKNWFYRLQKGSTILTTRPGGEPLTMNVASQTARLTLLTGNGLDSRSFPAITGIWTVKWNDDPVNSSTMNLTSFNSAGNVIGNSYSPGTLINGRMSGITQSWMCSPKQTGGIQDIQLALTWTPFNTGNINITDVWVIAPGNSLDTTNMYAVDQNELAWLSTPSGKFCPVLRFMDSSNDVGGKSNVVLPQHIAQTGFTWRRNGITTIQPLFIQPYSLTTAPSAYFDQWGWITPTGNIGWLYPVAANNTRWCAEVYTSGNHGLSTSQNITWTVAVGSPCRTLAVSGLNSGWTLETETLSLAQTPVIITSPSSFLFYEFTSGTIQGSIIKTVTQTTIATGVTFTIDVPEENVFPPEFPASMCAQISGCALWHVLPIGVTDACATVWAQRTFPYVRSGIPVYLEYTNEHWNFGFPQADWMVTLGSVYKILGVSASNLNGDQAYTQRASELHNIWQSVWNSGGRPNDIVRVFGGQYGNPSVGQALVNYAVTHNIRMDALAGGNYFQDVFPTDTSYVSGLNNWPLDACHDLNRHRMYYNSSDLGLWAQLSGVAVSYQNSTGSSLALVNYECEVQRLTPTFGSLGYKRGRDMFYHPEMYHTERLFYTVNARGGMSIGCLFNLQNLGFGGTATVIDLWPNYMYAGQQWGRGDGSDGKAVNTFCVPDGMAHDEVNVSVKGQAWKDWIDATASIPSYNVKPVVISETPTTNVTGTPPISITFNKAIIPSSIGFTLRDQSNTVVPGTLVPNYFNATFTPSANLSSATIYTATISGMVDTIGIPQVGVFNFQINGQQAITIATFFPAQNSLVNINTSVSGSFSANAPSGTFGVALIDVSGVTVPGSIFYNSGLFSFNFTYTPPLTFSDQYTATVTGTNITSFSWNFTTTVKPQLLSVFPPSGAFVNLATPIYALFNTNINSGTASFNLTNVSGVAPHLSTFNTATNQFNYGNSGILGYSATYTAKITGVTDLFGNLITGITTWIFQTPVKPVFIAFFPSSGAVVKSTTPVNVTFNTLVNTGTLSLKVTDVSGFLFPNAPSYNVGTNVYTYGQTQSYYFNDVMSINLTGVTDIYGNTVGDKFSNFSTTVRPIITSFNPVVNSTVNYNNPIQITFNTAIDSGLAVSHMIVQDVSGNFPGAATYNTGLFQLTFTPVSGLPFGDFIRVSSTFLQTTQGDSIQNVPEVDYHFNVVPYPQIIMVSPASASTNVSIVTPISALFNVNVSGQSIAMTVTDSVKGAVPGSKSYNSSTDQVSFNHTFPLNYTSTYTTTITGVTDLYGNLIPAFAWNFQTAANAGGGGTTFNGNKFLVYLPNAKLYNSVEIILE